MKIIDLLSNLYQENNNGNSVDKSFQPEEESKSGESTPFRQAVEKYSMKNELAKRLE